MAFSIFGKKEIPQENPVSSLPRAVAFVDYESWFVSLKTTYGIQPDIKDWFAELNKRYTLIDVTFFADFSHKSLSDEIRRIRLFSNKIIDTRSPNGVEKDYTDFIILDNIYQKALSANDIQTFILFSGDGHFSSAVSFLKNFYHKDVVVYGIQGCFSQQLQEAATEAITLPNEDQLNWGIYQAVFSYLKSSATPTFDGAVQAVLSKQKKTNKKMVLRAMELLESKGILSQRNLPGGKKKTKQLFVDWDKANELLETDE